MKSGFNGNLRREIGLSAATTLVIANMVGTGVFTASGFVIGELGSPLALLLVWVMGGLFAFSGALCYGELGAMLPQAGGEYVYLRRSFGPLFGFVSGWVSLIVGFSAPIAAASIAFGTYLLGGAAPPYFVLKLWGITIASVSAISLLAIAAVVVFSFVHFHSLRLGKGIQNLLTGFKIAFILVLVIAGFAFGNGNSGFVNEAIQVGFESVELGALAVALIFVSFAYSGWNAAAYLGGEIRNPERNLPRALLLGTAVVSAFYLLLNLLYLYALPMEAMSGMLEVGLGAATALFGPSVGKIVGVAVSFGLLSVVSAMIMAGPRVYYAMARDGLFFRVFGKVDSIHHTPAHSIFFQALLAIVMVLTATFETLLIYMGITLSVSAMLTVAGMMYLRWKEPGLDRPYKTFGYPLTPLLFIVGNLWIIVFTLLSRPVAGISGLVTIVLGALLYLGFLKMPESVAPVINDDSACLMEE